MGGSMTLFLRCLSVVLIVSILIAAYVYSLAWGIILTVSLAIWGETLPCWNSRSD